MNTNKSSKYIRYFEHDREITYENCHILILHDRNLLSSFIFFANNVRNHLSIIYVFAFAFFSFRRARLMEVFFSPSVFCFATFCFSNRPLAGQDIYLRFGCDNPEKMTAEEEGDRGSP
jgi:hypothetical protein